MGAGKLPRNAVTNVKVATLLNSALTNIPGNSFTAKWSRSHQPADHSSLCLPPDNATGNFTKVVQRVPVKIALEDSTFATKLRPGISVIATVRTRR